VAIRKPRMGPGHAIVFYMLLGDCSGSALLIQCEFQRLASGPIF